MNLPTQHQIATVGTHVATAAASVVATLGFIHVISPNDVTDATHAISQIGNGAAQVMAGVGTLAGIASGVYAAITSGPLASLFRASKTIAASPELTAQVAAAPLAEKAALVTVTDKLPEVVGVGTTRDQAGQDLAKAVPSTTVQPVTPKVA